MRNPTSAARSPPEKPPAEPPEAPTPVGAGASGPGGSRRGSGTEGEPPLARPGSERGAEASLPITGVADESKESTEKAASTPGVTTAELITTIESPLAGATGARGA